MVDQQPYPPRHESMRRGKEFDDAADVGDAAATADDVGTETL